MFLKFILGKHVDFYLFIYFQWKHIKWIFLFTETYNLLILQLQKVIMNT